MNVSETLERAAGARVVAVEDDLVIVETVPATVEKAGGAARPHLMKNEVVHILPGGEDERLAGEVLRIRGHVADVQVFEDTRGVSVGDPVELSGQLLSVRLGPGLLGQVYDGLQKPLDTIADRYGFFLPRGVDAPALDLERKWSFTPCVQVGAQLTGGDAVGSVPEHRFQHRILLPFDLEAICTVTWIQPGAVTVDEPVARLENQQTGREHVVTLAQSWPVRRPLNRDLLDRRRATRLYPSEPLVTTLRIIDTFFPIARGGTACVPGPFGAGKTVLQHLLARYAAVDVVVVVACGERAGEVVEVIEEFPKLDDPRGGSLMDRTIIICNTSSMPVAAREASIYTGITLAEYYRQMGLDVLLLADSTSRWAQAMRETSGRLEEIPGEEAFPAYLDSAIRSVYERAGIVENQDGSVGSLTLVGTVSPAGGNFEEPVTQSTLATVKTFLGLSSDRAYKRFYPAIDPLISWSRYLEQLDDWYERELSPGWSLGVARLRKLLREGDEIRQMMEVTGEEGVTVRDFVVHQKALLLDLVYLQQDAFDPVDVTTPLERQRETVELLLELLEAERDFENKDAVRVWFTRLSGLLKNLAYAARDSSDYADLLAQIRSFAEDTNG